MICKHFCPSHTDLYLNGNSDCLTVINVAFFSFRTGCYPAETLLSKELRTPHSPPVSAASSLLLEEMEKFSQRSSPGYCQACLCSTQGTEPCIP